jgi:heme/copper-type cytochrome/quinol oxidase subunit 4
MHLNLDPTIPKVIIIALLLFVEGIAIPTYTIVQQGRMPTALEAFGFFLTAFIQLCTFFVTFLKTGAGESIEIKEAKAQ